MPGLRLPRELKERFGRGAVASGLTLGQAVRAHFVELAFLPEATDAIAHLCPLPIAGRLL